MKLKLNQVYSHQNYFITSFNCLISSFKIIHLTYLFNNVPIRHQDNVANSLIYPLPKHFLNNKYYIFTEKIKLKKEGQTKCILDMSSKRKSQPTRIRDQQQEHELSPIPSPEMTSEKGLSPEIRTNLITMKNNY